MPYYLCLIKEKDQENVYKSSLPLYFCSLYFLIGITLFKKLISALKEGNIQDIKAEIAAYISLFLFIWSYFIENIGFMALEEKSYQLEFEIKILGVRLDELFHSLTSVGTS